MKYSKHVTDINDSIEKSETRRSEDILVEENIGKKRLDICGGILFVVLLAVVASIFAPEYARFLRIAALLGVVLATYGYYALGRRRLRIVLNDDGIRLSRRQKQPIPWDYIGGVKTENISSGGEYYSHPRTYLKFLIKAPSAAAKQLGLQSTKWPGFYKKNFDTTYIDDWETAYYFIRDKQNPEVAQQTFDKANSLDDWLDKGNW